MGKSVNVKAMSRQELTTRSTNSSIPEDERKKASVELKRREAMTAANAHTQFQDHRRV